MNKKYFQRLLAIVSVFFALSFMSCEKGDYENDLTSQELSDDDSDDSSSEDSDGDYSSNDSNTPTHNDTLTVSEFIKGNFEGGAYVKGYIVGDCTKSFKFAEFEPPFTHEQALLIADNVNERDKDDILAVQLPQGKKRDALNLVDHPENYKRIVVLSGYYSRYLYMSGLKSLGSYSIY